MCWRHVIHFQQVMAGVKTDVIVEEPQKISPCRTAVSYPQAWSHRMHGACIFSTKTGQEVPSRTQLRSQRTSQLAFSPRASSQIGPAPRARARSRTLVGSAKGSRARPISQSPARASAQRSRPCPAVPDLRAILELAPTALKGSSQVRTQC